MSANKSFSTETSERYSRALFGVAKDSGELDKIEMDIKNFQILLKDINGLKNFIQNPTQSLQIQKNLIILVSEKLNFSKKKRFFEILEQRHMFKSKPDEVPCNVYIPFIWFVCDNWIKIKDILQKEKILMISFQNIEPRSQNR